MKTCEWKEKDDSYWESQCGMAWEFTTGTPKNNGFLFCPGCGGLLKTESEMKPLDGSGLLSV